MSTEDRDLTGKTVVVTASELQEPLNTAPEEQRRFRCAFRLGPSWHGTWLVDGTSGNIAPYMVEKVLD